ncbi:MAG: hypothetical protein AAF441_09140 [Pseudomonadota bacterium]
MDHPNRNIQEIADGIRTVLRELNRVEHKKWSYASIERMSGVKLSSIKSFMAGKRETYNKSNRTIELLNDLLFQRSDHIRMHYLDLWTEYHDIIDGPGITFSKTLEVQEEPQLALHAYRILYRMLNVSQSHLAESMKSIEGDYTFYRMASEPDLVVCTHVQIRRKQTLGSSTSDKLAVWEYIHHKVDLVKEELSGDGIVVPLTKTIYCIGDVQNGQEIELLALNNPEGGADMTLEGFFLGSAYDRRPIMARTVGIRGSVQDSGVFSIKNVPRKFRALVKSKTDNKLDEFVAPSLHDDATDMPVRSRSFREDNLREPVLVAHAYRLVYRMLRVNQRFLIDAMKVTQGVYTFYRMSTIAGEVVCSHVRIQKKIPRRGIRDNNTPVWEYIHKKVDKQKEKMNGDGIVVPILNTIYCIGDIPAGQGIELISLKKPLSDRFEFLLGFTITSAYEGEPIMARIVARKGKVQQPGIYQLNEIVDDDQGLIKSAILNCLQDNRAHTFDGFRVDTYDRTKKGRRAS